jgi:hypothetical protein
MRWLCLLIFAMVGCASNSPPVENPVGPVLIHLPGAAGMAPMDRGWTSALKDAGLVITIEHYEWTGEGYRFINALQALERNRAECVALAERITFLARSQPGRRIIVTAQSAGAGFAIFALEKLPPDVRIDTLVLLAPAISGTYDLTPALRHVRREAYVFTSPHDTIVLGYGTRVFGTMDGRKSSAAGLTGFSRPIGGDPQQYAKLIELDYRTSWIRYSNWGDHTGSMTSSFAGGIVGPLLITGMLPQ